VLVPEAGGGKAEEKAVADELLRRFGMDPNMTPMEGAYTPSDFSST